MNIRFRLNQLSVLVVALVRLPSTLSRIQEALGRIENRQVAGMKPGELMESEFRVFSQWGDDGILQHLLRHVPVKSKRFVEFGVQKYIESNTRFLLINNFWEGLIIDASEGDLRFIRKDAIYWQYNLRVVRAFITRDNINELLTVNGMSGDIGLLSIDVDGNDYWIWEAIEAARPAVVVIEYNSRFGKEKAVTIPYREDFDRAKAHFSHIYFGASLKALCHVGARKGYAFVGCNSAGNNAFFVLREVLPEAVAEVDPEVGFVRSTFREARDEQGGLAFRSPEQEEALLQGLPVVDVSQQQ